MDLLVASLCPQRLWLTDAYFMANVPYLQRCGALPPTA